MKKTFDKKNTNDSRESAAIYVADHLLNEGYKLNVYDPMVDENRVFNDLKELGSFIRKQRQLKGEKMIIFYTIQ